LYTNIKNKNDQNFEFISYAEVILACKAKITVKFLNQKVNLPGVQFPQNNVQKETRGKRVKNR
jgi:hypothetical protein